MAALIGALRVSLGLDTAQFENGVKRAQSRLGNLEKQLAGPIKALSAAMAGAIVGVAAAVGSAIDRADDLGKMAQKIGIPVAELSRLKYAAEDLSDVSLETLSTSVGRLSKDMAAVASGGGKEAAAAFTALGISVTDSSGKLRSSEAVMLDIAARFAAMQDGAGKTALAMALFGRSGAEMIPLLNAGADGIKSMTDEARVFGLEVGPQAAGQAEQFNDNLTRLKSAVTGVANQLAQALLPYLVDVTNRVVEYIKQGGAAGGITESFGKWIEWAAMQLGKLSAELYAVGRIGTAVSNIFSTFGQTRDGKFIPLSERMKEFTDANEDIKRNFEQTRKSIESTLSAPSDRARRGIGVSNPAPVADDNKAEAPLLALARKAPAAAKTVDKASREAERAQQRLVDEGQRLWEETRTPAEKLALEIRRINDLMRAGAIDSDTYARAIAQVQDEFTETKDKFSLVEEAAQTAKSSFESWIDDALNGTFKLKDAIVALGKDILATVIKGGLFGGGSAGGGGGGLLGSLFSFLPGFAQGGSFSVGGAGGIDSKLVAFRATPGERVSVNKPGDHGGIGGELRVFVETSEDLNARVDSKIQSGMKVAVVTSVQESQKAVHRNMQGLMADTQRRRN